LFRLKTVLSPRIQLKSVAMFRSWSRCVTERAGSAKVSPHGALLRILATTDLHVHLLPFDYYTDRPQPATGLAQAATLIGALRAEAGSGPHSSWTTATC
jgi:2',3'-cyclic-nucleotide 2'-phosphodiesterase (5'-nucleotidase family)